MSEPREDEDRAGGRPRTAGGTAEQPPEGRREPASDGAATGTFKRRQIIRYVVFSKGSTPRFGQKLKQTPHKYVSLKFKSRRSWYKHSVVTEKMITVLTVMVLSQPLTYLN